jgi:hypothetical protein
MALKPVRLFKMPTQILTKALPPTPTAPVENVENVAKPEGNAEPYAGIEGNVALHEAKEDRRSDR